MLLEKKKLKCIIVILLISILTGDPAYAVSPVLLSGGSGDDTSSRIETTLTPDEREIPMQSQTQTPTPQISDAPVQSDEPEITSTPVSETTPKPYKLTSPNGAKYYKGSQKGIHYHKVKGTKIYHIKSYTTDKVKLKFSHPTTYSVYGASAKKYTKKKYISITSNGKVKCKKLSKKEKRYVIIKASSKRTGEIQYVYIYFRPKVYVYNGSTIRITEKKSIKLKLNYSKKKLSFTIKNKKRATVTSSGKIKAKKPGKTVLYVKVKGSKNNRIKVPVIVLSDPWIVSKKDKLYNYEDMVGDLKKLKSKYTKKVGLSTFGTSYDNRKLWYMRVGNPSAARRIVIDSTIHAREWMNTQLILRKTEEILRDYSKYKKRFASTCLYILPMLNPDGVSISQYGLNGIKNKKLKKLCKKIGKKSGGFSTWKNNARGVNLNNNFPSGFKQNKNAKKPDATLYHGKYAASEKETKAIMNFLRNIRPSKTINLHSTGSIIYWDYDVGESLHEKLYELASKINSYNGYRMMPRTSSTEANGGLCDWMVYGMQTVSVTIETGTVPCPLPHSQFAQIYKKNKKMFTWFMTKA